MADAALAAATRDLMIRAAWHYYVEGLTQEQVAEALAVSRAKVMRLLNAARAEGVVEIRVGARGGERVALERGLMSRYALAEAVVMPAPADPARPAAAVGAAAGAWLQRQLRPGITLCVGWGATLDHAWPAVQGPAPAGAAVVSLLGALPQSRAVNAAQVARRLAERLQAQCWQLTAPLRVADAATRDALWAEPALRALRARAASADVALVSVGDVSHDATLYREGVLDDAEIRSLRAAGAVGDVLCHFLGADGRPVEHPVNRVTMGLPLGDLARVARIAVASGGARKVAALRAALAALPVAVLITDEAAAAGLLAA